MSIENIVNDTLRKYPKLRKIIKRGYQVVNYSLSPKLKVEGAIRKITPDDEFEYFFGYYDKSPWNLDESLFLTVRVNSTTDETASSKPADIILIDLKTKSQKKIGESRAWNVQQGCMLQWIGPNFDKEVLYNDFRSGRHCTVIVDVFTLEERVIEKPVYSVSTNGEFALTLDFERLHLLREGYGYINPVKEVTLSSELKDTAIWKVNLKSGKVDHLVTYEDLFLHETRENMLDAIHKVNHIIINPTDTRFMVLHRWIIDNKTYTRLVTMDMKGDNIFTVSDDDMVSHCCWKDDEFILAYAHKEIEGNGYFLMKDLEGTYTQMFSELLTDGHPSYSPDRQKVITDTYPNRKRISSLFLIDSKKNLVEKKAQVFSPFKYDNEFRCDLHPKWDRKSEKVAIDSVHDGKRGVYIVELTNQKKD